MTELARLKFYATQPHPCSYLPEEQATTLFLDPSQPMDTQLYASLSEVASAAAATISIVRTASIAPPASPRAYRSPTSARTASSGASSSATRNWR